MSWANLNLLASPRVGHHMMNTGTVRTVTPPIAPPQHSARAHREPLAQAAHAACQPPLPRFGARPRPERPPRRPAAATPAWGSQPLSERGEGASPEPLARGAGRTEAVAEPAPGPAHPGPSLGACKAPPTPSRASVRPRGCRSLHPGPTRTAYAPPASTPLSLPTPVPFPDSGCDISSTAPLARAMRTPARAPPPGPLPPWRRGSRGAERQRLPHLIPA